MYQYIIKLLKTLLAVVPYQVGPIGKERRGVKNKNRQ